MPLCISSGEPAWYWERGQEGRMCTSSLCVNTRWGLMVLHASCLMQVTGPNLRAMSSMFVPYWTLPHLLLPGGKQLDNVHHRVKCLGARYDFSAPTATKVRKIGATNVGRRMQSLSQGKCHTRSTHKPSTTS